MTPAATSTTGQASPLKVSAQARPGSRVALEVAVPGGRCQASYDAALAKLSRSVKLPGFRKGKVPQSVLVQQLGPLRIRATALEDLVESVCRDALEQERIEALGRPELKEGFEVVLERFTPGAELVLTLEMDVEPTPSLKTTKGLKAEAIPVAFDPARVDEVLEESRRRLAALVPVEGRPAALGDQARIRFSGVFADTGDTIDGGSSEGMDLELEAERMIPGFVEGIVGMEVGDTRDVSCAFPESYPQEEAAGRPATFTITLVDLKTRELPELNDAFTKVAPEFYNRMIDELVRMADKFENPQPLIVICPDDKGEPWFQCSESAFNNLPWLLGAIEMAKASIAAPVMAEFEIEETDGAKE